MIARRVIMPVMVETISLMPVAIILRWVNLCGDDVFEHDQKIASLSFELSWVELNWTELQDPDLVSTQYGNDTQYNMFGPCNVYGV